MAKKQVNKEEAPKAQAKATPKVELNHNKKFKVIGTGANPSIAKDKEYLVGGQVAEILIEKGFAALK